MKPLFALACIVIASMPTAAEKPCIALDDKSPDAVTTNLTYHALIETAVTSSGDLDFFSTPHKGCWTIKVLAIKFEPPQRGYTLSWVGLDPHGNFLYHGVTTGAKSSRLCAQPLPLPSHAYVGRVLRSHQHRQSQALAKAFTSVFGPENSGEGLAWLQRTSTPRIRSRVRFHRTRMN
jgi:hypothetical protein